VRAFHTLKKLPGFPDNRVMRRSLPNILAHRGCLNGPDQATENLRATLSQATTHGFDVEFDVRFNPTQQRLVLSHDPSEWSEKRDAFGFLTHPGDETCHALNIKDWNSLSEICRVIHDAGTCCNFFLFDFELISLNLVECRERMRALQSEGFSIAFRLSEREPYLPEYLTQPSVSLIWLDEWTETWVQQEHLAALADAGKRAFYVSPDLHGRHDTDTLKRRWEQMASWGVAGICTDYPILLAEFLGATQ
jgi:glycerophosphoryl diester phosphodiesterase